MNKLQKLLAAYPDIKLVETEFRFASESICRDMRKGMTYDKKKEFRLYALETCLLAGRGEIPTNLSEYQIHHILPLSMGGGNNYKNLALVHPTLHAVLHEIIDEQKDRSSDIRLPYKDGLIWGLK